MSRKTRLGVGIVGFDPPRGWSAAAHLPALRSLPEAFHVAGIANSSTASAQRAAATGGLDAFASVQALVEDAGVDLVAVTVKAPHHAELVRTALAAGKHVFCEWPLARTLDEAIELTERARDAGVLAVAGMQSTLAPAVLALRDLIADGRLGTILSATIAGFGMTWGAAIEQRNIYLLNRSNGATMLTIAVGHLLAAVTRVHGAIDTVQATLALRRDQVMVRVSGECVTSSVPDQVIVAATAPGGVPISIHYRGGPPRGPGLVWQVEGTDRSARITAPSGLIEMTALTLEVSDDRGNWETVLAPVAEPVWDGVARIYAAIASELVGEGTADVPRFDDALTLHRVIDAIERSAVSGARVAI